jgi:hypothetical protein
MAQAEKTGAVSSPSQDDLQALLAKMAKMEDELARHREAEKLREQYGGVSVTVEERTSKAGRTYQVLLVSGGPFKSWGVRFTLESWNALMDLKPHIERTIQEHADKLR